MGKLNPTKLWEVVTEENMWRSFYQSYEILLKLHFLACSQVFGKQIAHTFSILDAEGFSIGMMNKKVYALV
jgi:hypothetical protein